METSNPEPSLDRSDPEGAPPAQQPVSGNKVERVAQHTQHLVQDLKQWIDLRIKLMRLEVEQRIESKANEVLLGIIVAAFGILAGVFGLVALALGFGAALGHPAWGFLIVTLLLVGIILVLRAAQPEFVQIDLRSSDEDGTDAGSASSRG